MRESRNYRRPAKEGRVSEHTNWLEGENFLKKTDKAFAALIGQYGHCALLPVAQEKYYVTLIKCILSLDAA